MPNTKIRANITIGVDHPLSTWSAGDEIRYDPDYCTNGGSVFNAQPNQLANEPGNAFVSNLDPGLRNGIFGHNGRIARGTNTVPVVTGTPTLDNTPLWNFIVPGGLGLAECSGVDTAAGMTSCMDRWKVEKATNNALGPLFQAAIGDAVRFAHVPEFYVDVSNGASNDYLIKAFRAVFLHATHWSCNANACRIIFEPGVPPTPSCANGQGTSCGFPTGANRTIEALTSFLLTDEMLPQSVLDSFPGGGTEVIYNLIR
jgi:hypothetical protein